MARNRAGIPGLQVAGLLAAGVLLVGCGDAEREAAERERRTAGLVVGTAAGEWGLVTFPRSGGQADLRPIVAPDSVTWNGSAELPTARAAWRLGEAAILLQANDGSLVRYDPVADEVTTLATLSTEARPAGASDVAIVFLDSAARFAYEVGTDYADGYSLPGPAAWAGPIDGGLAVLEAGESGRLRLLQRADTAAAVEIAGAGAPPATVTAWGRRVVVTAPDGGGIRVYSTDSEARLVGETELDSPVRALVASPSSHEIYVAHGTPPRLSAVSRFSFEARELARLPAPAGEIRPGLFGGSLIVRTEAGPVRFRTGDDESSALPGGWRSDLPLGLPGDLSIVLVDEEARLGSAADSSAAALAGAEPRWWIAVRFNPGAGRRDDLAAALDELGAAAGVPGESDREAEEDTEAEPRDEELDVPQIGQEAAAAQEGPAGYYAIVASARQRSGVEELLASLSEAGFPTRIQTYPDEAGEEWHRGLVGPFSTRARAQAAARQLLQERELQAWVTEIGEPE